MALEEKFMKAAEDVANDSPCLRRKYGAAIVVTYGDSFRGIAAVGSNKRMGRCCSDDICVRDRFRSDHAQGIERGAEIHAEMAVLVDWLPTDGDSHSTLYLAGFDRHGNQLLGKSCRPCAMCAMLIKYAGFQNVIIRNTFKELEAVSIDEIIEEHEASYVVDV